MSQSLILNRHSVRLKAAMQTLSTEATTGMAADQTARLHGNFSSIAGIESSLTLIEAYQNVGAETQVMADMMQKSLKSVQDQSSAMGPVLMTATSGALPSQVDAMGRQAAQALDSVMAALNTSLGDRALFSGQQTASTALASSDLLLSSLETALTVAGANSASEVEAAVTAWFGSPTGFAALIYQGGPPLGPVSVSSDQTAQLDITATDPALMQVLKGFATAALLSRGVLAPSNVARADLAHRAGLQLVTAQVPLTDLAARLGTTQAILQDATTRIGAEKNVLQTARLTLLSVDPYETATNLQETQSQLQRLYAITARAARFSLVDFL
jgi:flagellar hook-associated protein 3 FlgL